MDMGDIFGDIFGDFFGGSRRRADPNAEKQPLNELVLSSMNKEGIQVYIGEESPFENLKDCSVVTANYDLGDGLHGIVGIVGPKRMDYERVVGTLHGLKNQLDAIYKEMGTKKISDSGIGKDE